MFRLDQGAKDYERDDSESVPDSEPELASPSERDRVYRKLLSLLPLNDQHKVKLVARGFKESEIQKCRYKSHPGPGREQVAALLVQEFGADLCKKVPGILFKMQDGEEYVTLSGKSGMFLPVVNTQGQIVALSIRADVQNAKNRYIYFSSTSTNGPGPGVSVHVPQITQKTDTSTIRITEGGIKADLATAITDILTISVPGVGNWKLAMEVVKELKGKNVLIAFDADFHENDAVARSLIRIYEAAKTLGLGVSIETWDPADGKGIDDLLNKGEKPKTLTATESDALIGKLKDRCPEGSVIGAEPKPSCADIAVGFLKDKKWFTNNQFLLRYWREEFYLWNGRCYRRLSKPDLRAEVVGYVQSLPLVREKSGAKHGNEVLANIEALTLVSAEREVPCWIDSSERDAKFHIPMKNGVLDVKAFLECSSAPLLPHSSNLFSLAHVPYDFDPGSKCPQFEKFLQECLPNPEVRDFLQEWFGYNLVHDTTQAKFVILVGQGANGKSVICVVLRTLLGSENVSAIGLDQFSSERTFPLAITVGKLANIVEEMEAITKPAEGALKNFVGGGTITIEKKFKDAFDTKPTARLTFATNTLPNLNDQTDGIWRRLVVIPFCVQILDEDKQDKRLIDSSYWIDSGEIKGIFNFALEGLRRLRARGAFVEPEECRAAKDGYRQDMNVIGQFLDETCEASEIGAFASSWLYRLYRSWSQERGFDIANNRRFSNELKRKFPNVYLSKNPVTQSVGSRSREWHGVRLK
jgi:putative DNA primase/helicase